MEKPAAATSNNEFEGNTLPAQLAQPWRMGNNSWELFWIGYSLFFSISNNVRFWIVFFWMSNPPGWIQQEHLSTWWWRTPAAKWSWRAERWTGWLQSWTQSSSQLLPKIISKLLPKIISQLLPMIISQLLPKLLSPLLPKVTSCMQAPRSFVLQVMKKINFFGSPALVWVEGT